MRRDWRSRRVDLLSPAVYGVLSWAGLPLLGAASAYRATRRGLLNYAAWIAPPVCAGASHWLLYGYPPEAAPVLLCALVSLVGAAAARCRTSARPGIERAARALEERDMERDLLLTCDAGTTGCKCTVFDAQGRAVCSARRAYGTNYPRPNWAEQDPDAILEAVFDSVRELVARIGAARVACVGLSGTMNGCIPVSEDGRALHPNIIHSDGRTEAQAAQIRRVVPPADFYRLTGNRPDTH